jgi:aspartate-semialdehyde dehydrogenase
MPHRIAVIGAATLLGRETLRGLAEAGVPLHEVVALAGGRFAPTELSFGERGALPLRALEGFDFAGIVVALFAGTAAEAVEAKAAQAAGAWVVDATARHRLEPGVPLWLAEHGVAALRDAKRRLIALPDPIASQLVLALGPLHAAAGLAQAVLVTCESCAGLGKPAMDELFSQTRAMFVNDPATPEHLPRPIAFNVIPQTDRLLPGGADAAEEQLQGELRKLLRPELTVSVTRLRVPVFLGHAVAVHVGFERPLPERAAREALRRAPGLALFDRREEGGYTPRRPRPAPRARLLVRRRQHPRPGGFPHRRRCCARHMKSAQIDALPRRNILMPAR